jgi:hypothetical protein
MPHPSRLDGLLCLYIRAACPGQPLSDQPIYCAPNPMSAFGKLHCGSRLTSGRQLWAVRVDRQQGREPDIRCILRQGLLCGLCYLIGIWCSNGASGPLLPFTTTLRCCGAARRSGHSCIAQHFGRLKRQSADEAATITQGKRSVFHSTGVPITAIAAPTTAMTPKHPARTDWPQWAARIAAMAA